LSYSIPPKSYFELAAFAYLMVLHIISTFESGVKTRTAKRFRYFEFFMLGALVVSVLTYTFALPELGTPIWVCKILRTMDSMACVVASQQYALYMVEGIDDKGKYRILSIIDWMVFGVYALLMIINLFVPFILGYTEEGVYYHTGAFVPIVFFPPVYFMTSSLILLFVRFKYLDRRRGYTLLAASVVTLIGTIAQALTGGSLLLSLPCGSLGVMVVYFVLEAPDYRKLQESNEKLRIAEQNAIRANRAKSDFLASMSHEIRTPMNAVLGMDEMILRETEQGAEVNEEKLGRIHTYGENIRDAGGILLSIINDILDLSKIESGKMEIIREKYHFAKVLKDVCNIVRTRAEQKGLRYVVEVDGDMPECLYGDALRIRQILMNILNNAVKYTEAGSITLSVKQLGLENGILTLQVAVRDTGIGIRKEDQEDIFGVFQRVDKEANHHIEGTGLGLSIVKKLVDLMGGNVRVESTFGEGSCFTVELPQEIAGGGLMKNYEIEELREEDAQLVEAFRTKDCRFLLVDDNRMNLLVAKHFLDELDAEIVSVTSGAEALEKMRREKYDLIFMDHMMPEMDGVQVLENSRKDPENRNLETPMIMMTANALNGMREEYLECGFADYISKPIDSKQLMTVVRNHLPEDRIVLRTEK
jgi:signal transduction histidine kinase/ActR/RegA family two-component response regulator